MIRAVAIVQAMLIAIAPTTVVLAQATNTQSAPKSGGPPVLGETGTMYDGNNANLQLPAEPDKYWTNRWAASVGAGNIGPAGASGPSGAGPSSGGASGAGVE
ncbi:MAG: hypothetical protein JO107_00365 [Hyphomicrobiales bacterium]|nr:hypothetical protein [Hyphomicrobiales bacterium]